MLGPEWAVARRLAYMTGAPVPDHVQELLHRGRLADNHRAAERLGFRPTASTPDVIERLYAWPSVIRIPAQRQVA
jgi:UDP-glucose 4-epimerase